MLLENLIQYSCIISHYLSPLKRRFRDIQFVIVTNFGVELSVDIKQADCNTEETDQTAQVSQVSYPNHI